MFFSLIVVVFAGVATAYIPPNFDVPSSNKDLIVAFGSTPELNGVVVAKALTASAPTLATAEKLTGSYTVMMVDLDVPSGPGTQTSQLLHWMQSDLVSASSSTQIGGKAVYPLVNSNNVSAIAPYFGPGPPNKTPLSHRYVQLLLDTTDATSKATLAKIGANRMMFNAASAVTQANTQVLYANWFNVTFNDGMPATGAAMTGGMPGMPATGASMTGGMPGMPATGASMTGGMPGMPATGASMTAGGMPATGTAMTAGGKPPAGAAVTGSMPPSMTGSTNVPLTGSMTASKSAASMTASKSAALATPTGKNAANLLKSSGALMGAVLFLFSAAALF